MTAATPREVESPASPVIRKGLGAVRIIWVALVWQVLGVLAWGLTPAPRFLIAALCGSALILLLAEPAWARLGRSTALAAAFGLVWSIGAAEPLATLASHPVLVGAFLALGALADAALHPAKDDAVTLAGFGIPAFVFVVALTLVPMGRGWIVTQDAVSCWPIDRWAGCRATPWPMGSPHSGRSRFSPGSPYPTLPIEAALVLLVSLRRQRGDMDSRRILLACAVAGLAGVVGYWLCPATGPRYAFAGFPLRPDSVQLGGITVAPDFPRNAMPSLHFAWAWMLYRAARPVALASLGDAGVAGGNRDGRAGFGEHYLIDLVVAVPFVAAVEAGLAGEGKRLLIAGAIVAAWIVSLGNDGGMGRWLAWSAVVATVAVGRGPCLGQCTLRLRPGRREHDGRDRTPSSPIAAPAECPGGPALPVVLPVRVCRDTLPGRLAAHAVRRGRHQCGSGHAHRDHIHPRARAGESRGRQAVALRAGEPHPPIRRRGARHRRVRADLAAAHACDRSVDHLAIASRHRGSSPS